MKILTMTNTYLPHVGGVARSVQQFTETLRGWGHQVLVVAPTFDDVPAKETDVLRVPAIPNFNGSDFSVRLAIPPDVKTKIQQFEPQLVHSHHPFLMGDSAVRTAASLNLPLVFTHHTMYEDYTHYVPLKADNMRQFVITLSTGYANLCDRVVAPSESIASILRERGVERPIDVVPTGVDLTDFQNGDGQQFRRQHDLAPDEFVVGHVGRLAPEKNLSFTAQAVAGFLQQHASDARFVVVGDGPSTDEIRSRCRQAGVADRLLLTGTLSGQELIDAFHAMDAFAFASKTETQGMVLIEAMAAATPVVALDAPGAREVVQDRENGILLQEENATDFARALAWIAEDRQRRTRLAEKACATARNYSTETCVQRMLEVYHAAYSQGHRDIDFENSPWHDALRVLKQEWSLWNNRFSAVVDALGTNDNDKQ